jgi:hypothetical protein
MYQKEVWSRSMEQKHGPVSRMEHAEAWSKQKYGASRGMEQPES